jgi:hypothetical protein
MAAPNQSPITIRDLTAADFSTIAEFSVPAMATDEFVGFLYPHRAKHPSPYRTHFIRDAKEKYYAANTRCLVAEVDDEPIIASPLPSASPSHPKDPQPPPAPPQKRAVGWACWQTSPTLSSHLANPLLNNPQGPTPTPPNLARFAQPCPRTHPALARIALPLPLPPRQRRRIPSRTS